MARGKLKDERGDGGHRRQRGRTGAGAGRRLAGFERNGGGTRVATAPAGSEPPKAVTALDWVDPVRNQFFSAGANAVQFTAKVLEHRTVEHEAMRKKPSKSVLDNSNLTASQGIDVAQEMMNDTRREETGGVDIEDVSPYQVTLHRMFAKDIADWTGQIIGPPELAPLKTVDLLVAGTNLYVFDKSNKKLWEAKLTYVTRSRGLYDEFSDEGLPCLETKDALYLADKGVLTRFDLMTGNVRWRLTSVGISQIMTNDRGELYVITTTAGPDTIRYSQEVDLRHHIDKVLMRLNTEQGKALWSTPYDATRYRVIADGKFLFSTREWQTQDPLRFEDGPDDNFNMKLLKPDTGDMIWNYAMLRKSLEKVEVRQRWILLQFHDGVRVLKFFSL